MTQVTTIVNADQGIVLDLAGPGIQPLTSAKEDAYCVMKGTIPPGICVPLHSHPDVESFYLLSGEGRFLMQIEGRLEWQVLKPGDFVHIPENAKHAWCNLSQQPMEALIITTPKLGQALREFGRPAGAGEVGRLTPEEIQRLAEVAARYGHWLGSPEENAAAGIALF